MNEEQAYALISALELIAARLETISEHLDTIATNIDKTVTGDEENGYALQVEVSE